MVAVEITKSHRAGLDSRGVEHRRQESSVAFACHQAQRRTFNGCSDIDNAVAVEIAQSDRRGGKPRHVAHRRLKGAIAISEQHVYVVLEVILRNHVELVVTINVANHDESGFLDREYVVGVVKSPISIAQQHADSAY